MCFLWRKPKVEIVEPELKAEPKAEVEVKPEPEEGLREANIVQLIDRPYSLYSQKDPRWGNTKLGKSKLLMKDWGCLVCCIGMRFNQPPYIVNQLLTAKNGYNNKGEVIWAVVEDIFSCKYSYKSKDPKTICIMETNHYKPKFPKHFVLWVGDGRIVDPLDIEPIEKEKPYNAVSFRELNYA